MKRAGIHRMFVMEGERLVGIVTTMDIARAVAEHKLYVRRFVFERRRARPSA
jgi:CBS domain-containing protein